MLPNVDIDSVSSASGSVNHVLPGSEPLLPPVDAVIQVLIVWELILVLKKIC